MTFKTLFAATLTLFAALALTTAPEVEAKRFGGGSSLGKQSSAPMARKATPTQNETAAQGSQRPSAAATANTRPQSGASRWLGPLAGLAAGGLLASLFFGDAFQGFQFMDFVLLLLLIGGGVLIWRLMRAKRAGAPVPAAAGPYARSGGIAQPRHPGARPSGLGMASSATSQPAGELPAWFNAAGFTADAKGHFIGLQSAWDAANFQEIATYTTPELLAELQAERQKEPGPQQTEVVQLAVELLDGRREGDLFVVSLLYSGLIRERADGAAQPFREIWHIQHPWASPAGDWFIAGIQQLDN
ncbi:MAG: Tim44 domain-containing protein [Chromatiaceae bacterium]|nr:Tim44 domain-containing protein [Chromatiaceae bacterium]